MDIVKIDRQFRPAFLRDPYEAWRRYGDSPSAALHPAYTDRDAYDMSIDPNRPNAFFMRKDENLGREVPDLRSDFVPVENQPTLFGHCDLGQKRDACGVCFASVPKWIAVETAGLGGDQVMRPFLRIEFMARITVPSMGEIRFQDVRDLIYELQDRGFPIGFVTLDQWQSVDTIQQLNERGIRAGQMSIDRTVSYLRLELGKGNSTSTGKIELNTIPTKGQHDAAMRSLFSAFHEHRISLPVYNAEDGVSWLSKELFALEHVEKGVSGIVQKSPHSQDDLVQAVAGAVFNATNNSAHAAPVDMSEAEAKTQIKKTRLGGRMDSGFSGDEGFWSRSIGEEDAF